MRGPSFQPRRCTPVKRTPGIFMWSSAGPSMMPSLIDCRPICCSAAPLRSSASVPGSL